MNIKSIGKELKAHSPLTFAGAVMGIIIFALLSHFKVEPSTSESLFGVFHPLHVLLSAFATIATFKRMGGSGFWKILTIGWVGSIGIATLSDCIIPYIGEWMLGLPNRGLHLDFIHRWIFVNSLAFTGIGLGLLFPNTKLPHGLHVLISTWASLFHIFMAISGTIPVLTYIWVLVFIFLSVLIPCCTSDIVFPLFFVKHKDGCEIPHCCCGHKERL
jgi:hypothetical protein